MTAEKNAYSVVSVLTLLAGWLVGL